MPLVVPGINNVGGDQGGLSDWQNKLMGKKLGDSSDTTTFAKKDLPKESRVIEHGGMSTMDHKPDRLNVHLGKDGSVEKITKG